MGQFSKPLHQKIRQNVKIVKYRHHQCMRKLMRQCTVQIPCTRTTCTIFVILRHCHFIVIARIDCQGQALRLSCFLFIRPGSPSQGICRFIHKFYSDCLADIRFAVKIQPIGFINQIQCAFSPLCIHVGNNFLLPSRQRSSIRPNKGQAAKFRCPGRIHRILHIIRFLHYRFCSLCYTPASIHSSNRTCIIIIHNNAAIIH